LIPSPTCIVIPCYNEANRLPVSTFTAFLTQRPDVHLCFVNDGSTDQTLTVLQRLRGEWPGQVEVLDLPQNQGKAGAVRAGMRHVGKREFAFLGYLDADLATPLPAINDLRRFLDDRPALLMAMGSRIQFLGMTIRRQTLRHYAGRVVATCISVILQLPVYDTQCGAKLFRRAIVPVLFDAPFLSPWLFDVELLARLIRHAGRGNVLNVVAEMPLREWTEIGDSRIRPSYYLKLWWELYRIYRAYR
jgi:dolichyl-phosphate beta-glucosyltransferase